MSELDFVKKACFTGYRPEKFSFKLNNSDAMFCLLKSRLMKTLSALIDDNCKIFYTGMAQGFDILCAECVLELKKTHSDIRLICCLPHEKQEVSFDIGWRKRYYKILEQSDETVCISNEYHNWCFQKRNVYMVDNSDFVICWYDGKSGGTQNTVKYAQKLRRCIINLNVEYNVELNDVRTEINLI